MISSYLPQQNGTFRTIKMTTKKLLQPFLNHSHQKLTNHNGSQLIKNKPSNSYSSIEPIYHLPYSKKASLRKKKSFISNLSEDYASSEANNINQVVKKKHRLLIIKHKIQNQDESIPNILQIKDSVNKSQINFLRRMDVKLNASKHANLLPNLKNDLQIKSRDYLKQSNYRNKKSRRYLKQDNSKQQFIAINGIYQNDK